MERLSCITATAAECAEKMGVGLEFYSPMLSHSNHTHQILTWDQNSTATAKVSVHPVSKYLQDGRNLEKSRIEHYLSSLKHMPNTVSCELPLIDDLVGVIQYCTKSKNSGFAKCLDIRVHTFGLEAYDVPGTHLVSMCMACGNITGGEQVFRKLLYCDVFAWTSLLEGYSELGEYRCALDLIPTMQAVNISPEEFAFLALLKACARLKDEKKGRELHMAITKQGLDGDPFLRNSLLDMYAKCGLIAEAGQAFERLLDQDVIAWNTLLAGYVEHELIEEALDSVKQMCLQGIRPNRVTYSCVLKACGCIGALEKGYELHTSILKEGFEADPSVSSGLVDMYARCNTMQEAHVVFDTMLNRNEVAWTALIAGYAQQGLTAEALCCLQQMRLEGVLPNAITFVCALKACVGTGALEKGQEMHAMVIMDAFEKNIFVCTTLVDMYIKCSSLADAREVFNDAETRDVALWNAMISGYMELGHEEEAMESLECMQVEGVPSSAASLLCILKSCRNMSIESVYNLHCHTLKYGFERDAFIGSSLVDNYSKAGLLADAWKVFDTLQQRCVVSWNSLINGYAELGLGHDALRCLKEMQSEEVSANGVTHLCVLKACGSAGEVDCGFQTHTSIVQFGLERNDHVGNSLVDMYAKCGLLDEAQKEFEYLVPRNLVAYGVLITGYVEHGHVGRVLQCLEDLETENFVLDGVTYGCILKACGAVGDLEKGQEIHSEISKEGFEGDHLVVMNLMGMYIKHGLLVEAQEVFDDMSARDVALWSVLIEGYANEGLGEEALHYWEEMQLNNISPDNTAFICILRACAIIGAAKRGQEIHSEVIMKGLETDYFVGNTLIDMYTKCDRHGEARDVFDELRGRDRVSWNIMILMYAEQEESEHSLRLFHQMLEQGISPDGATFVNVSTACGNAGTIEAAKRVHSLLYASEDFKDLEPVLTTAIIDMYGKCGSMTYVQQVFDALLTRDLMRWTALISGYARRGDSERALLMFKRMREDGVPPSGVTYISILTACSHDGLVESAHAHYESMERDHNILPTLTHHNCMLALLGRVGRFEEALLMIKELPTKPDAATWSTVLSACQMWPHMEANVDKANVASLIMMFNTYADAHIGW